jgi:hypothetical protein
MPDDPGKTKMRPGILHREEPWKLRIRPGPHPCPLYTGERRVEINL